MRKVLPLLSCCLLLLTPCHLLASDASTPESSKTAKLSPAEQKLLDEGYRELKGEDLKAMISGNTERSSTGSFYYHAPDGTFRGKSGQSGKFFTGTWSINEAGRICRNWNTSYVESGCGTIYINDSAKDIKWLDADNRWYGTTFLPGNFKQY